jgi:hypothetical protein
MRRYIAYENNCLQCCLAALLDMPLEEVITRQELEASKYPWTEALSHWLETHGYVPALLDNYVSIPQNAYHILVYNTESGIPHGSIAKGGCIVYNPRPDENLSRFLYAIILIPLGDKTQQHEDISEFEGE